MGVQEHAAQPRAKRPLGGAPIGFKVPVLVVTEDGKSQVRQVHPNLMRSPSLELRLQEGEPVESCLQLKDAVGLGAFVRVHENAPLPPANRPLCQCQTNVLAFVDPVAHNQRPVAFFHLAGAQLLVQSHQAASGFGQQQHPGRLPVQAMPERKKGLVGTRRAHAFDDAKGNSAAPVGGHSGRLVQDQKMLIFVQYGRHLRRRLDPGLRGAKRRDAQFIAFGKSVFGLGSAPVDAHLAAANDLVDVALGDALGKTQQKIVQSLTRMLFAHYEPANGRRTG